MVSKSGKRRRKKERSRENARAEPPESKVREEISDVVDRKGHHSSSEAPHSPEGASPPRRERHAPAAETTAQPSTTPPSTRETLEVPPVTAAAKPAAHDDILAGLLVSDFQPPPPPRAATNVHPVPHAMPSALTHRLGRVEEGLHGLGEFLARWTEWYAHRGAALQRGGLSRRRKLVVTMAIVTGVLAVLLVILNRAGYP